MRQSLWLPGQFPGMNEIIAAAKGSGGTGRHYSRMKLVWTEKVCWLARAAKLKAVAGQCWLEFGWFERNRRRDPDNFCAAKKFVLDGLVMATVLKKDGWDAVLGWKDTWATAKVPGVLVIIDGEVLA